MNREVQTGRSASNSPAPHPNSLILWSITKQDFPVVFLAFTAALKDAISWLDGSHTAICKYSGLRGW